MVICKQGISWSQTVGKNSVGIFDISMMRNTMEGKNISVITFNLFKFKLRD